MKTPHFTACCFFAALLAGCSTHPLETRINEKNDSYAHMTPRQQELVRQGHITIGFTPDMVYMALSKPDRILTGPGPQQETWEYYTYYTLNGSETAMPRRIIAHDGGSIVGTGPEAGVMPGARHPDRRGIVTYRVEYDPGATQLRVASTRRVQVIFLRGRVADIRVQTT